MRGCIAAIAACPGNRRVERGGGAGLRARPAREGACIRFGYFLFCRRELAGEHGVGTLGTVLRVSTQLFSSVSSTAAKQ